MKVEYKYPAPSRCTQKDGVSNLSLSPDLSRQEKVSFRGRLKNPLEFRDAMLMLREIVIGDTRTKKKERVDFFDWLEGEIERKIKENENYLPDVRQDLREKMDEKQDNIHLKEIEIGKLRNVQADLKKEIDRSDIWNDYNALERKFWAYIRNRDVDLWFVLDPVITVHPDQVSFEAFSLDESVYGCLSLEMNEFELLSKPVLGTTNVDFSEKLAREMERFRTYTNVELSVNPHGVAVDTGVMPEYTEKKIDLPETWVKGFNQVSAAANLKGIEVDITPVDMYDICSYLRRHKEKKSPRYMKWILNKNEPIKIVFEPQGHELILSSVYTGDNNREEKIWGRRRWLVLEKLIPVTKFFKIKLLGFGLPQFVIADMGNMKMTTGFTSWAANDWVKGTAFDIMSGFIGTGNYEEVYELLKEKRMLSIDEICRNFSSKNKSEVVSGIGTLLKRGEGYYDAVNDNIRFRQLCNEPIPAQLYETTPMELHVQKLLEEGMDRFSLRLGENNEYIFNNIYKETNESEKAHTEIAIDEDGQISKLKCSCRQFNKGPRNISAPCAHILSLYVVSVKFLRFELAHGREYRTNDIMELLL